MNQLVLKGFEVIGIEGDDIQESRIYNMMGDPKKISKREKSYIIDISFKRGQHRSTLHKQRQMRMRAPNFN